MSVSSLSLLSPVIRVSQNFWPRRPLNLVLSSSFLIFPSFFQLFLLPSSLRPQRASSFLSEIRSLPLSPLLPSQLSGFSSEKVSTRGTPSGGLHWSHGGRSSATTHATLLLADSNT